MHALSFLMTFLIVLVTVPVVAFIAHRVGLVDKPDARRKLHARVVPLVGGIAIAVAVCSVILALEISSLPTSWLTSSMVLGGVAALFVVGVADDRLRLSGKYKILGQLLASGALIAGGVNIQVIDLFGWEISPGYLAIPLTIFWLVGASKSVNLLDGMDGMVGTVGLSMLLGMTALFALRGHEVGTIVTLAGAGALFGFLVFNLPPARIFMGDSGSMTLGLVLGLLALKIEGGDGRFAIGPVCIALFFLPIADSCAAFSRRLLTGRSIFATDRGHLHHRLIQAGYNTHQVLQIVLSLNLILITGVFLRELLGSAIPLIFAFALVGSILVFKRLFGHTELMLIARKVADRLPITASTRRRLGRAVRVHIQGSCRVWDDTWALIRAKSTVLNARALCLNISAPALHETYLARWDSTTAADHETGHWRADWPVRYNGQVIGWLTVVAEPCPDSSQQAMSAVTSFVVEMEQHITTSLDAWAAAKPKTEDVLVPAPTRSRLKQWRHRNWIRRRLAQAKNERLTGVAAE